MLDVILAWYYCVCRLLEPNLECKTAKDHVTWIHQ